MTSLPARAPDIAPPVPAVLPETFTTDRLLIRCPRPGDAGEVNSAIIESLPRLRPWFPWAQTAPSLSHTRAGLTLAQQKYRDRSDLRLLVFLRSSGVFVASSGLHRPDWSVPRFEIGYWARTGQEGQGYITEAVRGIAGFALDTLRANRLEIRCDARNARSIAVAERCGFVQEARLRHETRDVAGELRDTLIFARFPAHE